MKWLTSEWEVKGGDDDISFDVDSGLYTQEKITGFEKLLIHPHTRESKVEQVIEYVPLRKPEEMNDPIKPSDMFKEFPWKILKDTVANSLMLFGQYCSIAIGIYSMITLIKGIYIYFSGCCVAKKAASGYKEMFIYALSPMNFVLKKLPQREWKRQKETGSEEEMVSMKYANDMRKTNQPGTQVPTKGQMRHVNDMREVNQPDGADQRGDPLKEIKELKRQFQSI